VNIYINDLIKEARDLEERIKLNAFSKSFAEDLKNVLFKLEVFKLFGAKEKEWDEKLKTIQENNGEQKLLQKTAKQLLNKAKRLKKDVKEVIKIKDTHC